MLFQLDSRAADVAVEKARRLEFAEKTVERQKKLMQVEGTSQKAPAGSRASPAPRATTGRRANAAGAAAHPGAAGRHWSTRVNVRPGEAVDLTTVLAEVVDLDRLVVSASVPSAELAALKAGQAAEVLADKSRRAASPARSLTSVPQVDAKTGTALVRAALPASSGLRPGQFVTLRIVSEEHKDRLAVPVESVVKDAEGGTVIALVQGDKAVQKPVKAGLRDGGLVEVEAEGLQEDMTVVTEGAYGLPKETKVRVLDEVNAAGTHSAMNRTSVLGQFAIRHRLAIAFISVALCLAGIYAAFQMPSSVFPQTNFPRVVILVDNGVMPADEMMATITRPIEEAMKDIPGAVTIRSTTGRGSAEISVFFNWQVDMIQSELLRAQPACPRSAPRCPPRPAPPSGG